MCQYLPGPTEPHITTGIQSSLGMLEAVNIILHEIAKKRK